jgi:hypothetical protein
MVVRQILAKDIAQLFLGEKDQQKGHALYRQAVVLPLGFRNTNTKTTGNSPLARCPGAAIAPGLCHCHAGLLCRSFLARSVPANAKRVAKVARLPRGHRSSVVGAVTAPGRSPVTLSCCPPPLSLASGNAGINARVDGSPSEVPPVIPDQRPPPCPVAASLALAPPVASPPDVHT